MHWDSVHSRRPYIIFPFFFSTLDFRAGRAVSAKCIAGVAALVQVDKFTQTLSNLSARYCGCQKVAVSMRLSTWLTFVYLSFHIAAVYLTEM